MANVSSVSAATAPRRKKTRSLNHRKANMGYVFVAPFLIGFLVIYAPMVIESIRYSFSSILIVRGQSHITWEGFENYEYALFTDPNFLQTLISSLKSLLFNIPAIVIFALFVAILLNQKMAGRAVFRAIFFIPVIVSTGIIESIDLANSLESVVSSSNTIDMGGGVTSTSGTQIISQLDVQRFFASMQVGTELVSYVTNIVNNVYGIINKSGVQMLVFLAGLQSISPSIYESAYMEGASSWETFWKITFPMISPMILVNTIYTVIDSFVSESNPVMRYIEDEYSKVSGTVRSTAMSWVYFVVVFAILAVVALILSLYVFYQRKDT